MATSVRYVCNCGYIHILEIDCPKSGIPAITLKGTESRGEMVISAVAPPAVINHAGTQSTFVGVNPGGDKEVKDAGESSETGGEVGSGGGEVGTENPVVGDVPVESGSGGSGPSDQLFTP